MRPLTPLALLALAAPAFAAAPTINQPTPRGMQRGTEAVVTFSGARLADAQEVVFYGPGLSVTKLEAADAAVKATLKADPDCRLGGHAVRLRTKTGLSELRTFWVGALPGVEEKEPNSEFAAAQPVPLNVTVSGVVPPEDVDYFVFEAKKGQRVSAEIEAMRGGVRMFDPYIAILDAKRFEIAACDDSPLLKQDACVSVVIPADGKYTVMVRESSFRGNGQSAYRLHVGTFPRPLAVVPAGGRPGEELEVRFVGDPAGEFRQKVKLPAKADDEFEVFAQDAHGVCPSPMLLRVADVPSLLEGAAPAAAPCAFNGVVEKPGEADQFVFSAKKGQALDVTCHARRLGSPLDPVLTVGPAKGGVAAGNDDTRGPDSYVRFNVPADGDYAVTVRDHLGKGGPAYFYRVEVTVPAATVTTSVPRVDGNNPTNQDRQMFAVPRGNRFAALVRAGRANFGGPLAVGLEQLPPGVSQAADPMDAALDLVPVVFEARPDAPVGPALKTPILAKPADPKQAATCKPTMETPLTIGNPGQSVYARVDPGVATVAVTEAVPFEVTVVEPKAPIVRNGSMNLKIVAKRHGDFKGPITVVALWNPPGVTSTPTATIPEGATEAVMPMSAGGNAPTRAWKTAVLAQAAVGNGPVWVSSQLFKIEVAAPFVAFSMQRSAVERGKETSLFCKVDVATPFEGKAKVTLVGLPAKVAAPELEITKDTKELSIPLTTDKASPAGTHKNLFCQVVVPHNGEPVHHNTGGTELRIDVPLPPKPAAPAPAAVAQKPAPAKPAEPKRLSRLEQLRLEQEEREKAGKPR